MSPMSPRACWLSPGLPRRINLACLHSLAAMITTLEINTMVLLEPKFPRPDDAARGNAEIIIAAPASGDKLLREGQ